MAQRKTSKIPLFKTPYSVEKEAKDLRLYNDYNELMSVEGQSATGVIEHLMRKYNIRSASTVYNILKRVPARIAQGGEAAV